MDPMFTPGNDIYELYSDGSGYKLVAPAGVPLAWATARALGLVEGDAPAPSKNQAKRLGTQKLSED